MVQLSVLDLAYIGEGFTPTDALANALDLAQHAEGAGGIMLPNHSSMVIAEQFGTLATLFSGRIDLGLGRAPGTDQHTLRALRRGPGSSEYFPQDVVELQALLGPPQENQAIHAIPGEDKRP